MLQEVQEQTGVTPRGLLNRPRLRDDCLDYVTAYHLAEGSRQQGYGGPQALLLTEISKALDILGVARIRYLDYTRAIQILDDTYLGHVARQQA